jgi:hypothetical protein
MATKHQEPEKFAQDAERELLWQNIKTDTRVANAD